MPTYTFRNNFLGGIEEYEMKMSELDEFVRKNPELERVFLTPPNFGDLTALRQIHESK